MCFKATVVKLRNTEVCFTDVPIDGKYSFMSLGNPASKTSYQRYIFKDQSWAKDGESPPSLFRGPFQARPQSLRG